MENLSFRHFCLISVILYTPFGPKIGNKLAIIILYYNMYKNHTQSCGILFVFFLDISIMNKVYMNEEYHIYDRKKNHLNNTRTL